LPDKPKERRRKLYEIISDICEIPPDTIFGIPTALLRGKHELEVTGCTGVKEYTDGRIVLAMDKEIMTVRGEMLELTDFFDNVILIRGNIVSVRYGEEGGDEAC